VTWCLTTTHACVYRGCHIRLLAQASIRRGIEEILRIGGDFLERKFKRNITSLEGIFRFVSEAFNHYGIDRFYEPAIRLVVEELFTNLVKYNRRTVTDISITIDRKEKQLVLTMTDHGAEDFDITKTEDVDITKPLEERTPGGLGIHLVKKMADALEYRYSDGESRVTFIKNLER
jgi:serine/threonine-protein kinase RsbW